MKKLIIALLLVSMPALAAKAFFKRSYVDGLNRICIYDSVRGEVAITIRATKICPVTIEV